MFQRILVPLDGSERAERAIPLAARLARASGGTLIFLYVALPPAVIRTSPYGQTVTSPPERQETECLQAETYLKQDIGKDYASDLAGIPTEMEVSTGTPATTIFSTASLKSIDLIVMCSHGETGLKRWVFGSVAQEAVRHTPVPVLVLNEHGTSLPESATYQPLSAVVALDGSPLAESALEPAARLISALAAPGPGVLHLLRVVKIPSPYEKLKGPINFDAMMKEEARKEAITYLKSLKERLHDGLCAELHLAVTSSLVVSSEVAKTIIDIAEQVGSDGKSGYVHLLAMATHGRNGLQRLALGSITEHVVGATKLPLLMVRPAQSEVQGKRETPREEVSRS
ncbi:MAG TPA: universal stress protein [Ktedonosporobacter sp.]|nr:universal stress protein [Ktedonosporobacter sp.]